MTVAVCFTDHVPVSGENDVRVELVLAEPDDPAKPQPDIDALLQMVWLRELHRRLQLPVAAGTFPQYDDSVRVDDVLFIEIRVEDQSGRRRWTGHQYEDLAQRKIIMERINGRTAETRAGLPAA